MGFLSKLVGIGIGDAVKGIGETIDRFVETKEEKAAAEIIKKKMEQNKEQFQVEINKIEAGHRSVFVAGARPAMMWVCVIGIGIHFIFNPLMLWVTSLIGWSTVPPVIDIETLMPLVTAMLGLGAFRSYEKSKGISK